MIPSNQIPIDMDFARKQLRDASRKCDELLERTQRMLRESRQDNNPANT